MSDIPRNLRFYLQGSWLILTDFRLVYQAMYFVFAVLGVVRSDFFFAFHLADLIMQFSILQNVIKSVTKNALSLLLTVRLAFHSIPRTTNLFSLGCRP